MLNAAGMNATVAALNSLSIFGPHQAGAYREHSKSALERLGNGVETAIERHVRAWGASGSDGVLALTGNAGTGKTALAEAWCSCFGADLPKADGLAEVADGRWVVKDLSGVVASERAEIIELFAALSGGLAAGQLLLCANEGLLRASLESAGPALLPLLDDGLAQGIARGAEARASVINMNRQRWTSERLWTELVDYVDRPALWADCKGCSAEGRCPILANARALQGCGPREALRRLVQIGSGSAVAPLRELLGVLSIGITGGLSCDDVRAAGDVFDASFGYFNLLLGSELAAERVERSPLLQAMRETELGAIADLEVDGWLRDSARAPASIRDLSEPDEANPHSEVLTAIGRMTFGQLGETLTVSDDAERVEHCLRDLTGGRAFLRSWRRRVFFEAQEALGGPAAAFARLTSFTFAGHLLSASEALRSDREPEAERARLVKGLNYLAAGFHAYRGFLLVPDPASLVARNPGSYREADPSIIRSDVPMGRVSLRAEDRGELRAVLDTDEVRFVLRIAGDAEPEAELLMTPRLYQAIRESAEYRAPVGADIPEMTELEAFYADLSRGASAGSLRVVDPSTRNLLQVTLPDLV